ncbi:hypothetical protein VP01_540g9 [Puccinia sorghi]|uniref:Uncharacterized protein n=1 Tax=Puccinia sorghi TaxID=27349 RepID=A0A0L6UJS2_9BASI|nr:hypothetical protein VP01_540g9 [Puccinia sorghi]
MPNPSLGSRSQHFSGLPFTFTVKDHPPRRPGLNSLSLVSSLHRRCRTRRNSFVSSHSGLALESEDEKEHECHFPSAIQTASIENLSILFRRLYRTIEPISWSLPTLIYHQEHVVQPCCEALVVSDLPSSGDQLDQSSSKTRVLLIQAKDAVNLVATSLLDLLFPLVLDLSTSLLTPSSSTESADLTPTSLPSTENESREYSPRLANIWNVVRTPWVHLCRMVSNSQKLKMFTTVIHQVLISTAPSSRRLVVTSFVYLLCKNGISEPIIDLMLNDLNTNTKSRWLARGLVYDPCSVKNTTMLVFLWRESAGLWGRPLVDHRLRSRVSAIANSTESQMVQMSLLELQNAPQQPLLFHGVFNSLLISIIHHTTAQNFEPVWDSFAAKATERVASFKPDLAGVRNGSRSSREPNHKIPNMLHILGSILDLLADTKNDNSSSLSSAALLSLNLLSSIENHSNSLGVPDNRKVLDKLFAVQNRPLSIEHIYNLVSSLDRSNWPLFHDFPLPRLLPIVLASTIIIRINRKSSGWSTINQKFQIRQESFWITFQAFIYHHLIRLSSNFLYKLCLKECYDWISVSLLLPTPSDNNMSEGLPTKFISDYESVTPINRTMLLSTTIIVACRLSNATKSPLCTLPMDHPPFIVSVWGWHRGMLCLTNLNFLTCSDGLIFECGSSMSLSFESNYQPFKLALYCEGHVIRYLALEVLLTTAPPTSALKAILKQCLKFEDTPLPVENARIRQMHNCNSYQQGTSSPLWSGSFVNIFQLIPSSPAGPSMLPLSDLPKLEPELRSCDGEMMEMDNSAGRLPALAPNQHDRLLSPSQPGRHRARLEAAGLFSPKPPLLGQRDAPQPTHPSLKGLHLQQKT